MRDPRRGLVSWKTDVPFGISVVADGRESQFDYSAIPVTPLRQQMRDAALLALVDHGGKARSVGSAAAYRDAAIYAHHRLATAAGSNEIPLDIRTVSAKTMHLALFEGRMSPASVRTTLARRMLKDAAESLGVDETFGYLRNLRLYGLANAGPPYTDAELDRVLAWCKTQLNDYFARRSQALALIGADVERDSDVQIMGRARAALRCGATEREERFWVAQLYIHGFDKPPPPAHRKEPYRFARHALFPGNLEAQAAALLVINEYGAEGPLLVSMDTGDVRREANNSSVMVIRGVKSRADKAVSRKGNAVSPWSGGRVLERWIAATAPARRWTGTDHVWLWAQVKDSPKMVRFPIASFIPERPIIGEGGTAVLRMQNGETVRLSTRRMRKTWMVRADRAIGAGMAGAIDPNHSAGTAWVFYRSVGKSKDERRVLISRAQDDYLASIKATGLIISDELTRDEAIEILVEDGIERAAAERMLRGELADSGTSGCRAPYSAPEQAEGTLCRKTPYACLLCRNAVHTTAHLPVVLALRERIDHERATLPAEEFVVQWAGVDMGVDKVIAGFSSVAISNALAEISRARERIAQFGEIY